MKLIKQIIKVLFFVIVISLILFIGAMGLFPNQTSQFIGYRFYTVLSNSMEPNIPTYSLLCSKVVEEEEPLSLKKGDIITFKANRFQEDILITHRFHHIQEDDGERYYRTNAQGKSNLDLYETKRSDIVGIYMFHIPYIGKVILYLQSPFGFIMYGELFIIWLINQVIKARWKEKEKTTKDKLDNDEKQEQKLPTIEDSKHPTDVAILDSAKSSSDVMRTEISSSLMLHVEDIQLTQQGDACELVAWLHNDGVKDYQNIFVEVKLYDATMQQKKRYIITTMRHAVLSSHSAQSFCFRFTCEEELSYYRIRVV